MPLTEARTRRRLFESSDLTWDGLKLSGDIWRGIREDIEDIKLQFKNRSKVETGIRFNLHRELGSASRTSEVGLSDSFQSCICALNQDVDAARQGNGFI